MHHRLFDAQRAALLCRQRADRCAFVACELLARRIARRVPFRVGTARSAKSLLDRAKPIGKQPARAVAHIRAQEDLDQSGVWRYLGKSLRRADAGAIAAGAGELGVRKSYVRCAYKQRDADCGGSAGRRRERLRVRHHAILFTHHARQSLPLAHTSFLIHGHSLTPNSVASHSHTKNHTHTRIASPHSRSQSFTSLLSPRPHRLGCLTSPLPLINTCLRSDCRLLAWAHTSAPSPVPSLCSPSLSLCARRLPLACLALCRRLRCLRRLSASPRLKVLQKDEPEPPVALTPPSAARTSCLPPCRAQCGGSCALRCSSCRSR